MALAIFCFLAAVLAVLIGIVTEYRQTRAEGPIAIVGTMQWSPVAAIFSSLGLLVLPISLEWWWYPITFLAVLVISGWVIMQATKQSE